VSKLVDYTSDSGFHYSNDILFECGIDRKGILGVCLSACLPCDTKDVRIWFRLCRTVMTSRQLHFAIASTTKKTICQTDKW
jgi:hypothetical protein